MRRYGLRLAQVCSALLLALCVMLPVQKHTTFIKPDGRPAGFIGQLYPAPDSTPLVSYSYFWEETAWFTPVIFLTPLLLSVATLFRSRHRLFAMIDLASPLAGIMLFILLSVWIYMAGFQVLPGLPNEQPAYGGYLALAVLVIFTALSSALGVSFARQLGTEADANRATVRT